MNIFRSFLFVALLNLVPAASGQSSPAAQLPDVPVAPQPAKPSFTMPLAKYDPPSSHPVDLKNADWVCDAPPNGIYTRSNMEPPTALKGQVNAYAHILYSQIGYEWDHHMPFAAKNAWARGRMVAIRFAVSPDGSYNIPELTVSSGKPLYDKVAMDAIVAHNTFPPLPAGVQKPVVFCFRFGYDMQSIGTYDDWEKKPAAKQP